MAQGGMMHMELPRREDVGTNIYIRGEWRNQWSKWVLAMSPNDTVRGFVQRATPDNPNRRGYKITRQDLEEEFASEAANYSCGIYEWKIRKKKSGDTKEYVVYIGSTCMSKRGNFIDRINKYCLNGSHKSEEIDDALKRRYELWVRFKGSGSRSDNRENRIAAQDDENAALEKYDYAWNERNQPTGIRRIYRQKN